jgi:hypothetical protein
MARGRLISKSLGSSRRYHALLQAGGRLGEFCQLLFPLLVANTDDYGRMPGDAFTVKNVVLPSSPRPERDFDKAVAVIASVGLIVRYQVDGVVYLEVSHFDEHQPGLHKSKTERFPAIPNDEAILRENSDAPENYALREGKGSKGKGTEGNPELRTVVRAADASFELFWATYPKRKDKDAAKRAWDRRRPNDALLAVILRALERQKASPDWQRDSGRYVPYPATWLNKARWTDEDTIDVDGLSETARFNLAASDEAGRLITEMEDRRHDH